MQSFIQRWRGNGSIPFIRKFSKKVPLSKAQKMAKNRQEQMEGLLDVALHSPPLHGLEMKVRATTSIVEKDTNILSKKDTIITTTMIEKLQQLNHHSEVVLLWETMKHKSPASLTSEMLSLFVKSAEVMRRPQLIITMTDFAMNCDVPLSDMNKLCFIQACRTLASDHNRHENSSWLKAVGMLESTSFGKRDIAAPFSSGHPLDMGNDTSSLLMEMIEETVQACSDRYRTFVVVYCCIVHVVLSSQLSLHHLVVVSPFYVRLSYDIRSPSLSLNPLISLSLPHSLSLSGKWRNCLDIIEKTIKLKLNLTEKIVSSTILCCTKEKNGVSPAYTLFKFASSNQGNIPRLSMRVYTALLQGLARESYLDRYVCMMSKGNSTYRLTVSAHLVDISHQHPLSTHSINTLYRHILSTHTINTPYQRTLSSHPINSPIESFSSHNTYAYHTHLPTTIH